jgi:hypothetical protein
MKKMDEAKIQFTSTIELSPWNIREALILGNLSREQIMQFIVQMDEQIAETDFTLALIKKLVDSLKEDGEAIMDIREEVGL